MNSHYTSSSLREMSDTPLLCYILGSIVLFLNRVEWQAPHDPVGRGCTLSALAANLIGGMLDTPLTCYSLGSLVLFLISPEDGHTQLCRNLMDSICTSSSLTSNRSK